MFCIRCGSENPDAAQFCSKCGSAVTAPPVAAQRSVPAHERQNAGNDLAPAPARPRGDRVVAAISVGLCAIFLGLILPVIGYRTWTAYDGPCKAAALSSSASPSNIPECAHQRSAIYFYVAAFAVAGGGLKLAQRVGRK